MEIVGRRFDRPPVNALRHPRPDQKQIGHNGQDQSNGPDQQIEQQHDAQGQHQQEKQRRDIFPGTEHGTAWRVKAVEIDQDTDTVRLIGLDQPGIKHTVPAFEFRFIGFIRSHK